MERSEIILIGPIGVGKSTVGKVLAEMLSIPQCSMDEYRWSYYEEIGYDKNCAKRIEESEGFLGVYRYWKQFEIYAVERLLEENNNCVFDFGAGHSVYENSSYLSRAIKALKNFKSVVLLLPSNDIACSVEVLDSRNNFESQQEKELNRHFIEHRSNYDLAKYIVYTEGLQPEGVANEILTCLSS